MVKLKQIMKSKTMLFSIALAVLGVIELNMSLLSTYMSQEVYGIFVIVIGAITAVLRLLTTTSIEDK